MEGIMDGINGFGRAPKGVNDGNGVVFISHIGDVYQVGYYLLKPGILNQHR